MKTMISKLVRTSLLGVVLGLGAAMSAQAFNIAITVAPNVINTQSEAYVVTVHTDISYVEVVAHSVRLNGIEIHSWKADDRGNFVAKFLMEDVETLEGLHMGDYNELLIFGVTTNGDSFSGTDSVLVVDIEAKGKKLR